jgi:hypothetical protein
MAAGLEQVQGHQRTTYEIKPHAEKKKTTCLQIKEGGLLAVARNANPRGAEPIRNEEPTRSANNRPILYNANSG